MPLVRLGEVRDAAQAVVEQDGLDAGGREAEAAERGIVCVVPRTLEGVPGGLAALEAKELGELCGGTEAGEGVAGV